jgi:hypothetical protein
VLLTPSALTPQLRRAGYFVAMATIFIQVAEVFLRSWPFRFFSPAWRISFVSSISSIAPTMLLMVFVLIAIAILAGDRPLSLVFSGLAVLAAICFFLMSGTLMLDTLQMRNQVRVSQSRQYDITSLWTLTRVVTCLVGFVMLALAGLRNAIATRPAARQTKKVGTLIGVSTPTAGPRIGETSGVKGA